jgi:hypothetical protein
VGPQAGYTQGYQDISDMQAADKRQEKFLEPHQGLRIQGHNPSTELRNNMHMHYSLVLEGVGRV